MPTLSSYAPPYITPPSKRDGADFEPDDEWKRKLKQDIEQSFKSMIQEARDKQQVQLMEGNVSREELDLQYKRTLHNIKGLAEEQYQLALMKERNERRWIAGVQMLPGWNDVLHKEQQNNMNSIKQSNHSDSSARAAESPTHERGTNGSTPSSDPWWRGALAADEPHSSDPPPTRDRTCSRTLSSPSSPYRHRHDNNAQRGSSQDREDQAPPPPSRLRRHNTDQYQPTLSAAHTQDPEEQHRPSSRSSSGRPRSNSEIPWDSSLSRSSASIRAVSSADRHRFGRLPPPAPLIQNPDLRRLSTASQKDPPLPPATKYQIGRRGSPASIRSTGSGYSDRSIRYPTPETIPERAYDVEESPSSSTVKEWLRKSTPDNPPLPPVTKYQFGRRESPVSIRSTGSGHSDRSIRHPTPETIPERAYGVEESPFSSTVKEWLRKSPADNPPLPPATKYQFGRRGSTASIRSTGSGHSDRSIRHPTTENPPLPPVTKYQFGRRGSTASIRSTGSGHSDRSIRHPTPETIPERAYGVEESPFSSTVKDRLRKSAVVKPAWDIDSKRGSRRDSRPIPIDASIMNRYDHEPPPPPWSLRSAPGPSSPTRYATPALSSSIEDRFRHLAERDRPLKSSRPYLDSEDRDRDREREYHPSISHKSSFSSYDERWRRERERERDWELQWDEDREAEERDNRDRDSGEYWERKRRERKWRGRDWDHQRERDRGKREREYAHSHSTPYSPRTGGYSTPPSSASRVAQSHVGGVGDYLLMQDIYDDGAVLPSSAAAAVRGSYGSYRGIVPSPTVIQDEWDYPPRPESGRPSYRREGESRGTIDGDGPPELDGYIRSYTHASARAPTGSIPIPRPSPSNGGIIDDTPTDRRRHDTASIHKVNTKENLGRSKKELTRREAEFNLLQAPFRKGAEEIKRTRAGERKHQDRGPVIGSENWDRPQMKKKEEQLEEDELSSTSEESEHDDDEVDVKARKLEAASRRLEWKRREADVKIREQTLEFQRLKDEERRLEEEARKIDGEERRKLEVETRKKEFQIQEREAALLLREEELQRREVEAKLKEEDSKREELRRKEEAAREAAKWREEEATKQRDPEAREAAKRKEDEARAARQRNRREQAAQRQQQESERWFHEDEFIAGLDLTPRTFVRSGSFGFSDSEWMRPQADSHDDHQEKTRHQQENVESPLSRKPKERVIHPPSGEYLATKLVDNAPDRTNVIPREVLESKKTGLPAPWIQNSINPSVPRRPLGLASATFEIAHEDKPESPTAPNTNQVVQLPSQNSQRGTAPWILASRKLQVPQKPLDPQFKLHMADLRRQIDGASVSSTSSTSQTSSEESRLSIVSDLFSESLSIASLPAAVEFPSTPVFTDEIPRGLMQRAESSFFAAQPSKGSASKNPYLLQNSHLPNSSASLLKPNLAQHTPTSTGSIPNHTARVLELPRRPSNSRWLRRVPPTEDAAS